MLLSSPTQQSIQFINCATHEGKVVLAGTASDGNIYYTVKQDGYENTHNPNGWENWKRLEFPNEDLDLSVEKKEKKELTYRDDPNRFILRSRYRTNAESAITPVQLISALGHLYVFRQSKDKSLLVDRFVLDSMNNTLNRKYEVRYQQSRMKYEPASKDKQGQELSSFDSLSYRDKDGNFFYEPTTEISLVKDLQNGWFAVVLVPTNELDKYRWHIFAYNSSTQTVDLFSIRASEEGLFDVKDSTVFDPKPGEPEVLTPRSVPGIIHRKFELQDDKGNDLRIVNGLAATKYDEQIEIQTQDGKPQLLKDATKVMLVLPTDRGSTAALSFAVAKDGTLSEISNKPTSEEKLRMTNHAILLPLNTLDNIRAIADSTPAGGTIAGMNRGEGDRVQIKSTQAATLKPGNNVKIQGTTHYNGYYLAQKVDNNTFEITATWVGGASKDWQLGTWEEVPTEKTGLIFDGIITAAERIANGKLRITSPNHGLENGDGVQISDTQGLNGTYPVMAVDDNGFILDVPWQPGVAANVKLESRKQRGISFDGSGDYIETPALLELKPPSPDYDFGETYSAWIQVSNSTAGEQLIVGEKRQLMQLMLKDGKAILKLQCNDGFHQIADPTPVPADEWVHFAGSFSCSHTKTPKGEKTTKTILMLCRNGQQIASKEVSAIPETPETKPQAQNSKGKHEKWQPKFWMGGTDTSHYFTGKIAEVQVWNKAREPKEIRDSMYLRLTGKEVGLVGYWRLGAIAEGDIREVVDFSVFGNNGIVYGDPFVSAVILDRTLRGNIPVIQYTNDDLVAVTQQATYEESFEFKLDKRLDPNNIDGNGNQVFAFSYWGKANRDIEKQKHFSAVQNSFQLKDLKNGWYQASARFIVPPDGVKFIRCFGLDQIRGNWQSLEIRKHRIHLVSNVITEKKYADKVILTTLADAQAETRKTLQILARYEQEEALLLLRKSELEQASKPERKTNLETAIRLLTNQRDECQRAYDAAKIDLQNSWFKIIAKHSGKALDVSGGSMGYANVQQWTWANVDQQKWKFISVGDGYYKIVAKHSGKVLDVSERKTDNNRNVWVADSFTQNDDNQKWKPERLEGNTYKIIAKHSGKVLDVSGQSMNDGGNVQQYEWRRDSNRGREWTIEPLDEYPNTAINNANQALQDKKSQLADYERQLTNLNNATNNLALVNARLNPVQEEIKKIIPVANGSKPTPVAMPLLATDDRKLETQGGLLEFVRSTSRITAIETCEGNVQLSYFDQTGKMQQVNFDATQDLRNVVFKQWVPEPFPLCIKLSGSDALNCGNIDLANRSFTIEFWAKRDQIDQQAFILSQGQALKNQCLHIGFRGDGTFTFAFQGNDLNTAKPYSDFAWHHWTCVYDQENKTRLIYRDGEQIEKQEDVSESYQGSGDLTLGRYLESKHPFKGSLTEVRIWRVALSAEEIEVNSKIRLSGYEPGLLAYYPLNRSNQVKEMTGQWKTDVTIQGTPGWVDCTAPFGFPGRNVMEFNGSSSSITLPAASIPTGNEITISFWAKGGCLLPKNTYLIEAVDASNKRIFNIHLPWSNKTIYFDCGTAGSCDRINKEANPNDFQGRWTHWAFTKNAATGEMKIYCDGTLWHSGTGKTQPIPAATKVVLGQSALGEQIYYEGAVAELQIWRKARTQPEIQADMHRRLTGKEAGLVGYWSLQSIQGNQVSDLTGSNHGTVSGAVTAQDASLPIWEDTLISCEYSTIGLDADQGKTAIMRRFFASTDVDGVNLLTGQRIEELELAWIGNAQVNPTLLGYVEGAPPVPSENLTLLTSGISYNNASSVDLVTAENVTYSWNRAQDSGLGETSSLFVGVDQKFDATGAIVLEKEIWKGKFGFKGDLTQKYSFQNTSNVSASSGLNITNQLRLHGSVEQTAKFEHLGKRFIPKNVGYALVVSGLADMFVMRLSRSKKMVGYQTVPNKDIPLDVNTITFLINPAYTMNGSLDGMTGSQPASDRFFQHVPEMRSQYGSLYPASYFRLLEAYGLKAQIDYRDAQRKAYFEQFNDNTDRGDITRYVDETSLRRQVGNTDYDTGGVSANTTAERLSTVVNEIKTLEDQIKSLEPRTNELRELSHKRRLSVAELQEWIDKSSSLKKKKSDLKKLEEEQESLLTGSATGEATSAEEKIQARFKQQEQAVNASEKFAGWQKKMEDLQIRAGKRNIANTYVWDADGGFYSESQQFTNAIEHTIGGSFNLDVKLGGSKSAFISGFGADLSAQATVHMTQTMTQKESQSKAFSLSVSVAGVERQGVTDYRDRPLLPGEKVDRYRFMTFYLEGSTDNFNDFFTYVVDPEWLASNDEEARALRQVDKGSPNKTWRVLHRVTYVERPALMG